MPQETTIFQQNGYKIVQYVGDTSGMVTVVTPGGQRSVHESANAARSYITKLLKEDGVYGKGSFGNSRYQIRRRFLEGQIDEKQALLELTKDSNRRNATGMEPSPRQVLEEWKIEKRNGFKNDSLHFSNGAARARQEIANKMKGSVLENVGYMVMIEDKSKPGAAPTVKYAKDEQEAKTIVAHAKSMGLVAVMKEQK